MRLLQMQKQRQLMSLRFITVQIMLEMQREIKSGEFVLDRWIILLQLNGCTLLQILMYMEKVHLGECTQKIKMMLLNWQFH